MNTITTKTVAYTAAELQLEHPNGFTSAVERYTEFLWEAGLMTEDLVECILPGVLEAAGVPSLKEEPLRWSFSFCQGDGVSFDDFDPTEENLRELDITLPEGLEASHFLVRRDTGYIGNHYTHEYTFDARFEPDYYEEITDEQRVLGEALAEEITEKLRVLCRKMNNAGQDYVLDDKAMAERFLDGNDGIYDQYGECLGDITELDDYNNEEE
jgi:hypothetical protein